MFWSKKVEPVISLNEHLATTEAYKKELHRVEDNKNKAVKNAEAIAKERDELKEMVREQNEADLFFTSFKIVEELKAGKTKKDKSLSGLQSEQQRILAAQQQMTGAYVTYPTQGFMGQTHIGSFYPYV